MEIVPALQGPPKVAAGVATGTIPGENSLGHLALLQHSARYRQATLLEMWSSLVIRLTGDQD
jgi:hypothetical protein